MKLLPSIWYSPSPSGVRSFGQFAIVGTFAVATTVLLFLAWKQPSMLPFYGLSLLVVPAVVFLFRRPVLNLSVVLGLFVFVSTNEEGIQATEALYGVYYLAFLAHWFADRLFHRKERILQRPEDKAIFAFLILVTLWIPLTFLFGGDAKSMLSEWTALLFLGFYFPIREVCVRHPKGIQIVIGLLLWIGLFAAVRNVFMYRHALSDAEYAWQIVSGRVWMNDTLLMVTSIVTAALLIHIREIRLRSALGAIFLALFVGLVLTQSRSMWVAFALGGLLIFSLTEWGRKKQLLAIGAGGLAVSVVLGLVFFSEYIDLIFLALVDRFASLGDAFTSDLSLINRVQESKAVLSKVVQNPIVGYGMGVPFRFHDLTFMGTVERTFVHNGYVSLWYKFGIVGLVLILIFWFRSIWNGLKAFRRSDVLSIAAAVGLATAVGLICMMITANTSNPFFLGDTTLTFGLLTGLAAGARERIQPGPGEDSPRGDVPPDVVST